ncbi:hypothetical protein RchiOBHm_Chr4g0387321 [Rosa chinensis]|uniref:Uncharacterized protein n=1 Tax=Rosa chinensis TaxID=74649 RepID=A0A2P6QPF5_ROSCH|nr:hypothetical protein RchiOBHm_Chr4g0387321 [Rosa chinensis]
MIKTMLPQMYDTKEAPSVTHLLRLVPDTRIAWTNRRQLLRKQQICLDGL